MGGVALPEILNHRTCLVMLLLFADGVSRAIVMRDDGGPFWLMRLDGNVHARGIWRNSVKSVYKQDRQRLPGRRYLSISETK